MFTEARMALDAFRMVLDAVEILKKLINSVSNLFQVTGWGRPSLPAEYNAEFNNFDNEKIYKSRALIKQCFGDDIIGCFKNASNVKRINMAADFAERLCREYDLNIDVDVVVDEVHALGNYNWETKKAVFNIALIAGGEDNTNENFDYCVRETIDTIVHELRHAVQHKAINNAGFWNIGNDVRNAWRDNMKAGNYIRPEVDMRGYASQPIERDAFAFAAEVMKGLC